MGYMRHHAIMVTGHNDAYLKKVHAFAIELFTPADKTTIHAAPLCWVTPLSPEAINGYRSFFVAPDGSKEGWEPSDEADRRRQTFIDWLKAERKAHRFVDWAEVMFHDEGGHPKLLAASCKLRS